MKCCLLPGGNLRCCMMSASYRSAVALYSASLLGIESMVYLNELCPWRVLFLITLATPVLLFCMWPGHGLRSVIFLVTKPLPTPIGTCMSVVIVSTRYWTCNVILVCCHYVDSTSDMCHDIPSDKAATITHSYAVCISYGYTIHTV